MLPTDEEFSLPPGARGLAFKALIPALGVVFAVATLLIFAPQSSEWPALKLAFGAAFTVIFVAVLALITTRTSAEKEKRADVGHDLYSVIDRLVDDLDDDEAAYLQRRLEQRDAKAKDDLTVTLDTLLETRAEDRRAGKS